MTASFFAPSNPKTYMLLASLCFAAMSVCVKQAAGGTDFLHIVFFRSLTGLIFLIPIFIYFKIPGKITNAPLLILRSIVAFLAITGNFYGISHLVLSDATILMMTFPLFAVLFALLLLKEQVTRNLLFWLVACFVGILMILQPQFRLLNYAGLIALGAGFIGAIDVLVIHLAARYDHPMMNVLIMSFITTLLAGLLLLHSFTVPSTTVILWMIGAGLTSTAAQLFIAIAYGKGKISELVPFAYITVVLNFFIGILWWDEIPSFISLMGTIIVMTGCIHLIKEEKKLF